MEVESLDIPVVQQQVKAMPPSKFSRRHHLIEFFIFSHALIDQSPTPAR